MDEVARLKIHDLTKRVGRMGCMVWLLVLSAIVHAICSFVMFQNIPLPMNGAEIKMQLFLDDLDKMEQRSKKPKLPPEDAL